MYFDNEHRLGSDACWKDAQKTQSGKINEYYLYNPYKTNVSNCENNENTLRTFMAENHMNYKEGYGFANSCHIDDDTKLRNNSKITHGKCKNQLSTRLFTSGPDLSVGGFEPVLESRITQGENTSLDSKVCESYNGKGFETMTPLISCLKKEVQNPEHIVPKWIRGGESTRDHMKQKEFLEKSGYVFDKNVWQKKKM
jgi:hypothetical protein